MWTESWVMFNKRARLLHIRYIERFHSRVQKQCEFTETKEVSTEEKSSTNVKALYRTLKTSQWTRSGDSS